jgi:glycosyl transferase family 25
LKRYLINLDRSTDRLIQMNAEFQRVGVSFTRVPGVDGSGLSQEDLQAFAGRRPSERWTPGMIGCLLSHVAVWELIRDGDDSVAAVFEDDVHLADDIRTLLADDTWIPSDADLVRLEGMGNMRLRHGRRIRACPQRRVQRALSDTWGTAGYIIRKATAAKLLELPAELHRSVDNLLFMPSVSPLARQLTTYQVAPSVCIQDQLLEEGARLGFESIVQPGRQQLLRKPKKRQHVPFYRRSARVVVPFKP